LLLSPGNAEGEEKSLSCISQYHSTIVILHM
jgi:hypothetical protein